MELNEGYGSTPKVGLMRKALNPGIITGLIIAAAALLLYLVGLDESSAASFVVLGIFGVQFYIAQTAYKAELGGNMTYEVALKYALAIAFWAALVSMIYAIIYYEFINTNAIPQMLENSRKELEDSRNYSKEEIESSVKFMKMFMTSYTMPFITLIGNWITGAIMGVLISIFTKTKTN